jgi:hypothetical protein
VLDVSSEVNELMPSVAAEAARFVALRAGGEVTREQAPIAFSCNKCEFRVGRDEPRHGLRECWGDLADPSPHIFDLYTLGLNKFNAEPVGDTMIREGKTRLMDVDRSKLVKKDGAPTSKSVRQNRQLDCAESGLPGISPGMKVSLDAWTWPLHFIDFETSAIATPYHAGMYPYELVGFRGSCQTFTLRMRSLPP